MGAQSDFDMEQAQIEILRKAAYEKLREAEKAWHALFCALPLGDAGTKAHYIFENIRNSTRM